MQIISISTSLSALFFLCTLTGNVSAIPFQSDHIPGCKKLDASGTSCKTCIKGFSLQDGACQIDHCLQPRSDDSNFCITCEDGYHGLFSGICEPDSTSGKHGNSSSSDGDSLSDQLDNCEKMSRDGSRCLKCADGYHALFSGLCTPDSSSGKHGNSSSSDGDSLADQLDNCEKMSRDGSRCLKCADGYHALFSGFCTPDSSSGKHGDSPSSDGDSLSDQIHNCEKMSRDGSRCLKCADGYHWMFSGNCQRD